MSFFRFMRRLFRRPSQLVTYASNRPCPSKHCPTCRSVIEFRCTGGSTPEGGRWDGYETICPQCGPVTLDEPFIPDNDSEPLHITTDADFWTRCPCCGFRFRASATSSFRSGRHVRCGQRLIITNSNATGNA